MEILGIISLLLFAFCFVPQIIAIIRTKNVSGLSLWLWIMVVLGHACGLIYVIYLKDVIIIISYSIGLVLSFTTLVLIIYHRYCGKA